MSNIQKQSYRLISFSAANAAANMAIDEAILEAHLNNLVPPTLRLYQFSPPAVSFGYAQNIEERLVSKIQESEFEIVRRPTGGRAVLHFGDLTYAFICSSEAAPIANYALVSESVSLAYKQICQALIVFLQSFGVEVSLGQSETDYRDKDDCFSAITIGDLQFKGKKLIGSAQLRRRHAVLQHGSIILNQPQSLMGELLGNGNYNKIPETNTPHHANLYEIIKYEHPIAFLEKEIVKAFAQTFNCRFLPKDLTTYEQGLTKKLIGKYKNLVGQHF